MKLCKCGCGKEVNPLNKIANYVNGHQFRNPLIKKDIKQKILNRYGVENPSQSNIIKDKKKSTCLKNWGVEYSSQNNIVKEKIKKSCVKKYGVDSTNRLEEVKNKIKQTCINKFGVDNFSKTIEGRRNHRECAIKRIQNQYGLSSPPAPFMGSYEKECLDELQKNISFVIIRNKFLYGYYPDGFVSELKLDIEFDESHHDNGKQKEHDQIRDTYFIKEGCRIFRIRENDWKNNKENIISDFLKLIQNSVVP